MFLCPSQACSALVSWPALAKGIAAAMPQHVQMDRKRHFGAGPIRPNSAWKALNVIGPSRSVIKTCEDGPCSRCNSGHYPVAIADQEESKIDKLSDQIRDSQRGAKPN